MLRENYCFILIKVLKKEYQLLSKLYYVETKRSILLKENKNPSLLMEYNEKSSQILGKYSRLEKKRAFYIKKLSYDNHHYLKNAKELLKDSEYDYLCKRIKKIQVKGLEIDFLNQTNQDMIKNNLGFIQFSLDNHMRKNQALFDIKI